MSMHGVALNNPLPRSRPHPRFALLSPFCPATPLPCLQCGAQQQLRRALELVAEMRSRGIPCNVHTYSALMNVCIKVRARLPAARLQTARASATL